MGCFSIRALSTEPESILPPPNAATDQHKRRCNFHFKERVTLRTLLFSMMLLHAVAGFFFGHKLNDPDARHTIGRVPYANIRD